MPYIGERSTFTAQALGGHLCTVHLRSKAANSAHHSADAFQPWGRLWECADAPHDSMQVL